MDGNNHKNTMAETQNAIFSHFYRVKLEYQRLSVTEIEATRLSLALPHSNILLNESVHHSVNITFLVTSNPHMLIS